MGSGPAMYMATPICYQSRKNKKGSSDIIFQHEYRPHLVHLPWKCPLFPETLRSLTNETSFETSVLSKNSSYNFSPSTTFTYKWKKNKKADLKYRIEKIEEEIEKRKKNEKAYTHPKIMISREVKKYLKDPTIFPSNISLPTKVFAMVERLWLWCWLCIECESFPGNIVHNN